MSSYVLFVLVMGLGFSCLAGPLGSIMIWKRLSFFGDTIAHAALLGVGIAFVTTLNPLLVLLLLCLGLALVMILSLHPHRADHKPFDAKLALVSHGALALGIMGLSFLELPLSQWTMLLFGDILSVSYTELLMLYGCAVVVVGLISLFWRPIINTLLSEEIAMSMKIRVRWVKIGFAVCLGLTIGLTLKLVGALLMTALLIIPCLTAHRFAKTPQSMMIWGSVFCFLSFIIGVGLSYYADTPTGPSVVTAALMLYVVLLKPAKRLRHPSQKS